MSECKCTLSQRLTGDGCFVCNPAKAYEYAMQTINDQADEIKELEAKLAAAPQPEQDADGWLAKNQSLRAEIDRLVIAIADHVTVRTEQYAEIERLKADIEAERLTHNLLREQLRELVEALEIAEPVMSAYADPTRFADWHEAKESAAFTKVKEGK